MNMTGAFVGAAGLAFAGSYALAALCWLAVDVTQPLVPRAEPDG